jgi:hypothetical protein
MKKKLIWLIPLGIVGMAAFIAIGGEIVRQLWNWLVPALFGWKQITFWQALGLLLLCRILFGGFGMGGGNGKHKWGKRRDWREKMEERCANLSPEEREKFRERMRERWGFGPAGAGEGSGGKE